MQKNRGIWKKYLSINLARNCGALLKKASQLCAHACQTKLARIYDFFKAPRQRYAELKSGLRGGREGS